MPDFDAELDGELVHYHTGEQQPCYQCGKPLDVATQVISHSQPKPEDISICLYCGAIAIFIGTGFQLRTPTPTERTKLLTDPRIFRAVTDIIFRNETPTREPPDGAHSS